VSVCVCLCVCVPVSVCLSVCLSVPVGVSSCPLSLFLCVLCPYRLFDAIWQRGDEDTEGDASLEAQLVNTAQGYAPRAIEPTLYSISLEKQKFNEVMERSGGLISRGL